MKPEGSKRHASFILICLVLFNFRLFFGLECSCQGDYVLKYLSLPSFLMPVLTVDEVTIELVLTWNQRPVNHLGEESLGAVGRQQLFLSSTFSLLMDL